MKYLSVCSGIEAATVAWHPLGFKPVAFSEIKPFPCSVLKHHYPDVPNLGDMTKFEEWDIEPCSIEILVGGTPCQSFSVAGLRGGLEDSRGNLALTYCRILQKFRPRWFVWENVPGVLSSNGGRDFGSILGAMAELGYGFAYRVLDAQFFGVPQRRRRVFVVGHLGDWRRAAEVLFEPGCLRRDTAKSGKKRKDVAGTLGSRTTAGGGLGTDFDLAGGLQVASCLNAQRPGKCLHNENLISSPMTSRPYGDRGAGEDRLVVGTLGSHHGNVRADQSWQGQLILSTGHTSDCLNAGGMGRQDYETETMVVAFGRTQVTNKDNRSNPQFGDPCHPLVSNGYPPAIAFSGRDRGDDGRGYGREPNITGPITETIDATKPPRVAGPAIGVRRLTTIECERLQGFPDDYTQVPHGPKGKPAADGPRYQAIGNSMAVPVMRWIGERIQQSNTLPLRPER